MTQNIRDIIEIQHDSLSHWTGELHEVAPLMNAALRYTDIDPECVTSDHLNELDAILSCAKRIFCEVENEMGRRINALVEMLNRQ